MKPLNLKKEIIKVIYGLGYVILIISVIHYFNMNKWQIIGFLCFTNLIFMIVQAIKTKQFSLKKYFSACLYIAGMVLLINWLNRILGGVWGYWVTIFLIVGLMLFKRRKKYFEVKHRIESMLFGKPLYKYREKGQKPPSINIIKKK